MVSNPAQKLAAALEACSRLRNVPEFHRGEPDQEAFEAVRAAVAAARRDPAALDVEVGEERAAHVVELVAKIWREKRVLRGRVRECLQALLARDSWLAVAKQSEALQEVLAQCPDLQVRLEASSLQAPAPTEPLQRGELSDEVVAISESIARASKTMREFGYCFPQHDLAGAKLDTATESFMAFYDGLARLCVIFREPPDTPPPIGLSRDDWTGVLHFLVSMHELRKSYRSRIEFVVARLRLLVPVFAGALAAAGPLPWIDNFDEFDSPAEEEEAPEQLAPLQDFLQEFGHLAVHNEMHKELVLYVEETQTETRVLPGRTALLDAESENATVRVNFVGLLGFTSLRTRLARLELRHRTCYVIAKNAEGKTECVER